MGQKTRTTLKEYFESGKIPTEGNFVDLIDSFLNYIDDEIYVRTTGQKEERKKCIGLGTETPGEKLEVKGNIKADEFKGQVNWSNLTDIPNLAPRGLIAMWSGSIEVFDDTGKGKQGDILEGWALCNKENGTPDLRGRFIVGHGKSPDGATDYRLNTSGGKETHQLSEPEMPRHLHRLKATITGGNHKHTLTTWQNKGDVDDKKHAWRLRANHEHWRTNTTKHFVGNNSGSHSHDINSNTDYRGNGQPHENRPPYYVLAYIMKL